eukprot:4759574-Amphidinium_carterae.1
MVGTLHRGVVYLAIMSINTSMFTKRGIEKTSGMSEKTITRVTPTMSRVWGSKPTSLRDWQQHDGGVELHVSTQEKEGTNEGMKNDTIINMHVSASSFPLERLAPRNPAIDQKTGLFGLENDSVSLASLVLPAAEAAMVCATRDILTKDQA